jgi:hypothetical protein
MSAHVPSLSFELDPLIAEAKRRRKRRLLGVGLVLLLAGGATAGTLLSRSSSGPGASGPTPSAGLRHSYSSSKGWSMRYSNGMYVEHASAGGISYAVDEVTVGSFMSRPGVQHRERSPQGETIRPVPPRARLGEFPADGIAVRVLWLLTLGRPEQGATQLPLQLSSFSTGGLFRNWYPGTHPRPLQHVLVSKWQQRYFVQVWIGSKASALQRALVGRIVASIAVRHPR